MPASAAISFRAPIAAPLRARASARRVHARRAVVAALPQKGKTALTGVLRVPKSEEAKMDAMWESHEKYMRDTHVIAGGPETTDEKPRVLEYYVSKAVELTDPTDADSAPTGNLLYCVNEKYVDPAGLETHMALGQERWEYFPLLMESISKYGAFLTTNGVILTNFSDAADPCTARKGDVTINTGITVPESMEDELDDLWAKHETFMRETHQFGDAPGDDLERPRITQFTIVKAKELRDPMDPSEGFTGNVQYSMQETYVAPEGVKGHFAALPKAHPDVSERLLAILTDPQYQKFGDVGQGEVITSMDKNVDFVSNIVGGLTKALETAFPKRAPHEEWCEDYCPEEW